MALLACWLLAGCGGSVVAPPRSSGDAVVYVIGRGWHTDIGLPVGEVPRSLAGLERRFPGAVVFSFGFGDREFLLKRTVSPLSMLAALLPGRGALLVTALNTTPERAFGADDVVTLGISKAELARLQARLRAEFELSASGEPIFVAAGPYAGSGFYAASATYSGLYTCNTWTADMLHAGGQAMPTAGVLFADQVMGMARWLASPDRLLGR